MGTTTTTPPEAYRSSSSACSPWRRSFKIEIYAVGRNIKEALAALAESCGWDEVTGIEDQKTDVPCEWFVRFHADGTSMKASGEHVAGGVIVLWWK